MEEAISGAGDNHNHDDRPHRANHKPAGCGSTSTPAGTTVTNPQAARPASWLYPNGVALAGGVVYGDTTSTVFALSAATGKTIWVDQDLLRNRQDTFGIQPLVARGVVYAMNAGTGKLIWKTLVGEHSESDNYPLEAIEHTLTLTAPTRSFPAP